MKWWTLSGNSEASKHGGRPVEYRTLDLPSPNAFVSLAEGGNNSMDMATRESSMSGADILLTYAHGRRALSLSSVNASATGTATTTGELEVLLKVNLPEPGLLWPSVFQALEPPLWHILLSTVSGLVYRIVLDDLAGVPVKAQHQGVQVFSHQLASISVPLNLCHVVDLDTFVLASSDNRILQLECPRDFQEEIHTEDGGYRLVELQQEASVLSTLSSLMQKSILTPFTRRLTLGTPLASQVDLTEQTVSLASLCYGRHMLLFSLSRGGRLRIWNLISHVCIKSLSSLGSARDSSSILVYPSQPHKYIQVFNEQESFGHGTDSGFGFEEQAASFCLALYSPLSTDGETRDPGLQVYFARIDAMAQLRDFSLVLEKRGLDDQDVKLDDASLSTMHLGGSEETFVDFIVESVSSSSSSLPDSSRPDWTVWTLWNKGRQAVVRYTALALPGSRIDFGISSRWIETSSNLTDITMTPFVPTSEATSLSVQEQVLEYVFRPGQFSFETIKKALEAVSPSPTSAHRNTGILTWSDLQAQVVSFIGSQIVVPADAPDKFVAFNESLVAEYNRFLSFCWQFDRQERIPSCLAFFGSDKCVIQRCGWASLREMDPPRAILSQDPLLLNASPALLHSLGWTAELCRKEFISDLSLFHDLSDSLALFLVPEKRAAFDFYEFGRLLESLDMSVADYSELLRMRYLSDIEGHPDTIQSICGLYTSMRHPQVFFRTLLQIVLQGGQDLDSLQVQVEAQPSMMSERALSQSVAELIRSRHKLASSLLLVVLVVSHLQVPASHKVPALIVAETVAAFHSLCVLHLLAAKRIEARANQSASILSRMSELSVDVTESKQFTASTLLSHLIQHHYLTRTANGLSSDSLTLVASDWISLLSVSPYPPSKSIRMTEAVLKLSNKLIAFGHTQIALDVLDLYPKTAGACFLLGQIWMDKIDFEKARRYFEQAALGLVKTQRRQTPTSDLAIVVPPEVMKNGLIAYNQLIMSLFAERHVPDMVVSFAKTALECLSPETRDASQQVESLRRTIFNNSLDICEFDEAYASLTSLNDIETKHDCLRRFVSSLCEQGDIDGLARRYAFGDLQSEVEKTLLFKARTESLASCVLRKTSPNYFKILYSFYIHRNDFRNASLIMYRFGRRLESLNTVSDPSEIMTLLTEQGQSLLVALNALTFVEEASAWFTHCEEGDALSIELRRKKRKLDIQMTQALAEFETGASVNYVDVVTLPMIRQDYSLVMAKLILASNFPEFSLSLSMPDPEDAMALYVQAEKYSAAITLGKLFGLDLRKVFSSLAERCARESQRLLSTSRGSMDDVPLSWEGPVVDKAWQLLSDLLEKHDTSENAYSYRKAVVEKLLSMDSNVRLPSWLTTFYQAHAPEDLIQAYLRHGSWMQLLPFVTQHLHGAAMSFPGSLVPKPAGRWMPYSLLDQLLDHFKKTSDQSHPVNLEKGARELQMALQVYMAQVESESRSILSQ